ncbi:MAG: iron export ABC transporter permease subunit FetB [Anaerolineae bacterium]
MLMPGFGELSEFARVGLAMVFVVVAGVVSRWQHADLEKDLFWATVRSFVQLIAIGYVLELVFAQKNPLWTLLILGVMLATAARTTARRAAHMPGAQTIALTSIGIGSALTLGVLLGLGVFRFTPQDVIPIGGMIIGNAMTTAALVMTRLSGDLINERDLIEAMLALSATGRQASLRQFRAALRSAMLPIIDTTKTVGLIKLPGAMTGMILAGATPLEAIRLQLIVMYMLVGANTFTGIIAAYLTYRQFFSADHRLELPENVQIASS